MADTGWVLPTDAASETVSGGDSWTDPINITDGTDDNYATATLKNNASYYLNGTNFDFDIPTEATIDGIEVRVRKSTSSTLGGNVRDHTVQLMIGGSRAGSNYADTTSSWPVPAGSPGNVDYGGPTNLWGLTPTVGQVTATNFGVSFRCVNSGSNSPAVRVWAIWARIHYTEPVAAGGSMFMLFSVKDRIREIIEASKPKLLLPELA